MCKAPVKHSKRQKWVFVKFLIPFEILSFSKQVFIDWIFTSITETSFRIYSKIRFSL